MTRIDAKPKTRLEAYLVLTNISILFDALTEESKEIFLDAMNRNPLQYMIQNPLSISQISNYNEWNDYFLYQTSSKEKKVIFVCKSDIPKVLKNIRTVTKNDWILKDYKMN